jgi:hypothetical protein
MRLTTRPQFPHMTFALSAFTPDEKQVWPLVKVVHAVRPILAQSGIAILLKINRSGG